MRRVIIELDASQVADFLHEPRIKEIEVFETLAFLSVTRDEAAVVARVKFRDPGIRVGKYFTEPSDIVQVLDREKNGAYVCFMKGKIQREFAGVMGVVTKGYVSLPYELKDGRMKVSLLGSGGVIKRFLRMLGNANLRYALVSLTDAKFSSNSPLGRLTEKQQKVVETAFNLGYYDLPRRASSADVAKKLGIAEPTLVRHRRKAEHRLLEELLRQS